jgi:hypothetical protein
MELKIPLMEEDPWSAARLYARAADIYQEERELEAAFQQVEFVDTENDDEMEAAEVLYECLWMVAITHPALQFKGGE